MPDNTRLKPEEQHAERELEHIDLLPDDPVRGLVFIALQLIKMTIAYSS
jgi:hypothetical protein